MANAREILSRMKSVQDTRKITNAMYLISSTKMKKSRKLLDETEPYFYTLQDLIRRILRHMPEVEHRYFDSRSSKSGKERVRGLVVITGDKGLAGAYNHNVLKIAHEWMQQYENNRLYVVGELGRQYFASRHVPVDEQFHYTVQNPTMHRARLISSRVLEEYETGNLDEVWILYTQMVNSMAMEAQLEPLLPLKREDFGQISIPADIIQEEMQMVPSPEAVMDHVVPNYVTGFIFGALVESFCSEQNARMMAMQSASDNASALLNDLSIEYNRVRQAAITQEITEVIGGAKAQKKKHNR
ncbi:MAG: ATP synthase F1 subunit gamma [Clostridiales bacterium]|nr:ATP synthase F1 subunit gamma [Clostridiales bacterium]